MAKIKEKKDISDLSKEEIDKLIRSLSKDDFTLIGDKEISAFCTAPKIRTNLPVWDYLLGGGISKGRCTCIAGDESSGKTTESLEIIAALIRDLKARGSFKKILWNDVEGAWDAKRAKSLGVDQDFIVYKRMKVIEDFFKYADDLISTGYIEAMVIDSLDNMIAKKTEENAYNATMGSMAGALGQHLPNLFGKIIEHDVTTIFIKQVREKVGGFNPSPQPILQINGGRTFRHDMDTIIFLKRLSNKDKDYCPVKIKAEKTRSSRHGLTYQYSLGAHGNDRIRDIITLALEHGMINVGGGGWTTFEDVREHGLDNFIAKIKSDEKLYMKLWDKVYSDIIDIDNCLITGDEEGLDIVDVNNDVETTN